MDYRALAEELTKYLLERPPRPKDAPRLEKDRGELMVLAYLTEFKDGATPGELAKFGDVSTARIATALKSLEKKGYIIRSVDPEDRRKVVVHITDDGKAYGNEHKQRRLNHLAVMLEFLGEEDAVHHIRIMKRLNEFHLQESEE